MVDTMHIIKNSSQISLITSKYDIIETVAGTKNNGILPSKKSDTDSICFGFIAPSIKSTNKITIARTLPGNGNGRKFEIIFAKKQIAKIIKVFLIKSKVNHLN